MQFPVETVVEFCPADIIMQADDYELQDLISKALTRVMMEEQELTADLKAKLRYACIAFQICTQEQ